MITTQTVRKRFLEYFQKQQHTVVPSSSVVPHGDATLLFINAGMNQFKDVFLGKSHRDYKRAASSQKCIRAGGKHNDLENVGHTSRHLTFFEMLGNFSFGDYFKAQAIRYAWEVSTEIFGFDPESIWPTVFLEDDEAFELWTHYVPAEKITRMGEKDNFWAMGDTGPCGPCSELYFDRGEEYGSARNPAEDITGNRYIEFWNLVFMQYNSISPGIRESLPRPSIDTGAGIERVLALKLGVDSVFETDILRNIIGKIEELSGISYRILDPSDAKAAPFRVIADHLRSLSFAIADGVQPGNVDRGYVLRKILRRAVRYGRSLGFERPFLADLLPELIITMGDDYPELIKGKERIAEILTTEEEAFLRTLKRGGGMLHAIIDQAQKGKKKISGDDAFKLKDTYGLPIEEILLMAKDSALSVDQERYFHLEAEAKERSRSLQKTTVQSAGQNIFADFANETGKSKFVGYYHATAKTRIVGIVVDEQFVQKLEEGKEGIVFLKETPFFAEMGGQVGDRGHIKAEGVDFVVEDCQAPYKGLIAHKGKLAQGSIEIGMAVEAFVDKGRRVKISNNHTATHLLHWALHQILGEHIKQAGSVVGPDRLRFDFSHHKALTQEQLRQIETLVNEKIRHNRLIRFYDIPYAEAQKQEDIKQFFGEKYDQIVHVVDIDYSKELCGGTHAHYVGDLGLFRIVKEGSIAAGIRRIEAMTGEEAELYDREIEDRLLRVAQLLKVPVHQLEERTSKLLEEHKQMLLEIKKMRLEQLNAVVEALIGNKIVDQHGAAVVIAEVSLSIEELRQAADLLLEKLRSGIVILGASFPDKCQLVAKVSDDLVKRGVSAHDLLKEAIATVEGSGGGKAHMAQGGGRVKEKLPQALEKIKSCLI